MGLGQSGQNGLASPTVRVLSLAETTQSVRLHYGLS